MANIENLTTETVLTETQKTKLKEISPYALPDNVGESGLSSQVVKAYFYNPLLYLYQLLQTLEKTTINNDNAIDSSIGELNQDLQEEITRRDTIHDNLQTQITTNKTNLESEASTRATNDTALSNRVKAIEDDYLVASDKTELQGNIDKKLDANGGKAYNLEISQRNTALDKGIQPAVVKDVEDAISKLKEEYSNDHIVGLELVFDTETYKIKVKGTTEDGNAVYSNEIDLPSESSIVNIEKTSDNKGLIFTLRNGNSTTVDLGDIVGNFVTKSDIARLTEIASNEDIRITNENTRIANEKARQEAEAIRVTNENERIAKYDGIDFDELKEAQEAVEALKIDDLQNSVTYTYKIQVSSDGQPQLVLTTNE